MKWFRLYDEIQHNTTLRRMPIPHRYAFIVLLCMANRSPVRGIIVGKDDDDIAFDLEMEKEDWLTLKSKFKVKGLIDFGSDGIKIVNWDERQYASDSSAERVAKYREKKKKKECNVTSALLKRCSNVSVTPPDTDSDPKADSETDSDLLPEGAREKSNFDRQPIPEPVKPDRPISAPTEPTKSDLADQAVRGSGETRFSARAADPFFKEIPLWRNSLRPNDWNEDVVQGILAWLRSFAGESKTRGDAIAYITARESVTHSQHEVLVARAYEIKNKPLVGDSERTKVEDTRSIEEIAASQGNFVLKEPPPAPPPKTPEEIAHIREMCAEMQRVARAAGEKSKEVRRNGRFA